ncbi:MAG TPA: hypothetical protein DCO83_09010 [Mucilaginibacter sp.]|jgi:hypothetical protein|nr:hypothetical protein [Mucilaginibacter sp.]
MRKYITLFFSVTFFLSACKGGKAPDGIINHDQMIVLLTQVHIVDGSLFSVTQNPDSLYKYGTDRYLALFKRYHTDSVQFRKSLKYYTTQPVELTAMYDKVLADLKQKTDSLTKTQLKKSNALPPK